MEDVVKIHLEIESENWHAHEKDHGYRFIGFQPTSTNIHANPHCVVLTFGDDDAGIGVQVCLTHQSWQEYLMALAKARETTEAKREYEEGDHEE
jgi:hypothetical protein